MPTSVHLPKPLLDALDARAKVLHVSRNRLIVQTLESALAGRSEWSAGFFATLSATDESVATSVDEMMGAIKRGRRSKKPRRL
jgi:metal-responsive CopG/Arc/MetJ family transcriptional regulator